MIAKINFLFRLSLRQQNIIPRIKKNLNYLNIYDGLILAANGNHGLYVHNRKFYWNSEENILNQYITMVNLI